MTAAITECAILGALESAADHVLYTARQTASGLSPEAWARHTMALNRLARAKDAARASGYGLQVREIDTRLTRETGSNAHLGADIV